MKSDVKRRGAGPQASYPEHQKNSTAEPQPRVDQLDTLILPALKQKIVAARVLTGSGKATFTQSDNQVTITLPADEHDKLDTIFALDCESNVEL